MAVRMFYNYLKFHVKKVIRNYNVIERTEKLLDKEKPVPAPRHPGIRKNINIVVKNSEAVREKLLRKPEDLLERLKSMKIESTEQLTHDSKGKKPEDRRIYQLPEFGYLEPRVIPEGRCTLRQALQFITKHSEDREKWTPEVIAEEYKMKVVDVQNILYSFRVFTLYIPQGKKHSMSEETLSVLGFSGVSTKKEKTPLKDKEGELPVRRLPSSADDKK